MNPLQATALIGLRLIGFFGLVQYSPGVVAYAPTLFDAFMTERAMEGALFRGFLSSAFQVSLAMLQSIALIVFARPLSRLVTPKAVTPDLNLNLDADQISRLSISILGLALIAYGLPRLLARWAEIAFVLLRTDPSAGLSASFNVYTWPNAVVFFFCVVVGAGFLLAAFRIDPFLRPLRRAGTGAHLDEDPNGPSQSKAQS